MGPDTPIIWTIFSPLMILPMLLPGGRDQALALLRAEPAAVEHAFDAMTETLAAYARECLAAGADGLFYATNMATRDLTTAEECRRFQRPYDLRILAAVASAPFNLLHVCGTGVLFDEFADYPATALQLGDGAGESDARRGASRAPAAPSSAACPPSRASRHDRGVARRAHASVRCRDGGPLPPPRPRLLDQPGHAGGH